MTDWNSDPELRKMREEFIGSFSERRASLSQWLKGKRDRQELLFIAHRLAGAAESYDFPLLSRLAGELEDWLSSAKSDDQIIQRVHELDQALQRESQSS